MKIESANQLRLCCDPRGNLASKCDYILTASKAKRSSQAIKQNFFIKQNFHGVIFHLACCESDDKLLVKREIVQ